MTAVLPDASNGGLPYRTVSGACSVPAAVQNAYCPAAAFTTTCDLTALPSDCTARITAAQINAIVSEMLALAECFNPTGTWNCASLTNLCSNFTAYRTGTGPGTLDADVGRIVCAAKDQPIIAGTKFLGCDGLVPAGLAQYPVPLSDQETIGGIGSALDPYAIIPLGVANAICADPLAAAALTACVGGGVAGDGTTITVNAPFSIIPLGVANAICGNVAARNALQACIGGGAGVGDGVTITAASPFAIIPLGVANAICATPAAVTALRACISLCALPAVAAPVVGDRLAGCFAGTQGTITISQLCALCPAAATAFTWVRPNPGVVDVPVDDVMHPIPDFLPGCTMQLTAQSEPGGATPPSDPVVWSVQTNAGPVPVNQSTNICQSFTSGRAGCVASFFLDRGCLYTVVNPAFSSQPALANLVTCDLPPGPVQISVNGADRTNRPVQVGTSCPLTSFPETGTGGP